MDWSFENADGTRLALKERAGTVVNVQVWSETKFSGPSFGGQPKELANETVIGPDVYVVARTKERNRAFIKFDDEAQETTLNDLPIPVRPGSNIRVLVGSSGQDTGVLMVQNVDTGEAWVSDNARPRDASANLIHPQEIVAANEDVVRFWQHRKRITGLDTPSMALTVPVTPDGLTSGAVVWWIFTVFMFVLALVSLFTAVLH